MSNTLDVVALSGGLQRPSRTLPIGLYVAESDFDHYEFANPALRVRIALAMERAVPQLCPRTLAAAAA